MQPSTFGSPQTEGCIQAARLRQRREILIDRWTVRVLREGPVARIHGRAAIADSIPKFLDELERALESENPAHVLTSAENERALEQDGERTTLPDCTLADIFAEYDLFRQTLFSVLEEGHPPLGVREREIIIAAVFRAVKAEALAFVKTSETQAGLARRAQAGKTARNSAPQQSSSDLAFRALFEGSPGFYLVIDPSFKIVAASEAYLHLTMTVREEILSRDIFEVFPENPEDKVSNSDRNIRRSFERVLKSKTKDVLPIQRYDIRKRDGTFEERYWSAVNSPVLGQGGEVLYIIQRVEDVTEYVRLKARSGSLDEETRELLSRTGRMEAEIFQRSQELRESNLRLESMNETLRDERDLRENVMNLIAHDLRSPLTAAKTSAQLITRRPDRTDTVPQLAVRVIDAMNRADRMIQDLLDSSRLRAGKGLSIRLEETNLSRIVRDACDEFSTIHGDRFITRLPSQELILKASPSDLRRALDNLVDNAVKYGNPNEPITVGLESSEGRIRLWVHDFGPVVPADEQAVLFRPFARTKSVEKSQTTGWGLGLSLVRGVAEAHGGSVSVKSTLGEGTTFTVELPVDAGLPSD